MLRFGTFRRNPVLISDQCEFDGLKSKRAKLQKAVISPAYVGNRLAIATMYLGRIVRAEMLLDLESIVVCFDLLKAETPLPKLLAIRQFSQSPAGKSSPKSIVCFNVGEDKKIITSKLV